MKLIGVAFSNLFFLHLYYINAIDTLQTELVNIFNQNKKTNPPENINKNLAKENKNTEVNSSKSITDNVFAKESADILETGKELIKKNNELIKNIENGLKKINKIDDSNNLDKISTNTIVKKNEDPTISKEKNKLEKVQVLKDQNQNNDVFIENQNEKKTITILNKKETSPIKKLSNLLFKSTLITKSEILNKEDAAILIENNDKLKSMINQLQKIFDTNTNILNKFIDGEKEGMEAQVEINKKPKDLLKYQVIEITEKKIFKNNKF